MSCDWLPSAALTDSRRPVLLTGEVERFVISAVDLEPEDNYSLSPLKSGLLYLTTHRIIWVDDTPSSSATAFSVPLSCIIEVFPVKRGLRSMLHSPRVRIQLSSTPSIRIGGDRSRSVLIMIVLRGKNDPESFYGRLVETMRLRAWEAGEERGGDGTGLSESRRAAAGEGSSRGVSMPVVGVSGIMRKEQEMWESTDKSLQDAFQDLDSLMSKAKEMVGLAEKMRQKLLSGSTPQGNGVSDEEIGSKQEMQDWLLSVGIASPVTKESAGALYHQQLSRQLADFVKVEVARNGGMVSLVDVYCLFNRARGTELISPDDLLQACHLWDKFDVSVTLRKFDSGVMVLQSKAHSDEEVFARIRSLVLLSDALQKGISPSDAARTLGIAPALAKEHLLAAESKGLLCRDISPEGFRFYINLFKELELNNMYMTRNDGLLGIWLDAVSAVSPRD